MTAFTILASDSTGLTGTANTFQPDFFTADSNDQNPPKQQLIRLWSNRNFHVRMDGEDATLDDFPVADHYNGVVLSLPPGGSISVIKATGETDGSVWFSLVKRN